MSDTETPFTPTPIPPLPEGGAGWVEPVIPSLANDLTDRLVALWPHTWEERDGDYGRKMVAVCHVWLLDGDDGPDLYGTRVPIRWQTVQKQLRASSDEAPWVVGTVKQKGRSYVIEPPAPSRRNKVTKSLKAVAELIAMGVDEAEGQFGSDVHDEEPF